MKLPERLVGIAISADGRPAGSGLPSLDERGAASAWRQELGPGPYLVRFEDRVAEPDLDHVQRLARLGEVWLDCAMDGVDGALDLLVAGASRLVVWGPGDGLLEAVGDSAVLGWDGAGASSLALDEARRLEVPVLALAPAGEPEGVALYQAPALPWTGPVEVVRTGVVADDGEDE